MLTDTLLNNYINHKDDFIISSTAIMNSALEVSGNYPNLNNLMYTRALYFLLESTDCYTEEVKSFLNAELDSQSIKPGSCSPSKF